MAQMLNRKAKLFADDDGTVYPITNWIDFEGDECEPEEAITCVAGRDDCWFVLILADFTESLALV